MDAGTITAVTAAAAAGKAIVSLVRDLRGSGPNPPVEQITDQLIGLQSILMDVQSEALSLQNENAELRRQLAEIEDWTAEKEKYELIAVGSAYLYSLKTDNEGIEPHWICGSCYEARRKSLLVLEAVYPNNLNAGYDRWICVGCESRIQIPQGAKPGNVHGNPRRRASLPRSGGPPVL